MLPLSLFGHRLFALTSLVGLLVNIAFYGLIFVLQPVLPAHQRPVTGGDRSGVRADDGRGAAGQSGRCPRDRTAWCANDHCARCGVGGFRVLTLLGIAPGTSYWKIVGQFVIMGGGLGLLVPPLTSALLGSVDKSRSGIAAGVLNATRQTGSVLGVALFGSLIGRSGQFMSGAHHSLMISTALLLAGLERRDWVSASTSIPAGTFANLEVRTIVFDSLAEFASGIANVKSTPLSCATRNGRRRMPSQRPGQARQTPR